jgi:hypothetical protein
MLMQPNLLISDIDPRDKFIARKLVAAFFYVNQCGARELIED